MAKLLFIDDRIQEVHRQWTVSGCENGHTCLIVEAFASLEQILNMVGALKPDVICIGHGLGTSTTGADVIKALRQNGYSGKVIANSGGGKFAFEADGVQVDATADRKPGLLKECMDLLFAKQGERVPVNLEILTGWGEEREASQKALFNTAAPKVVIQSLWEVVAMPPYAQTKDFGAALNTAEALVKGAFEQGAPKEILEALLEIFLGTWVKEKPCHGYWVHSLSHFTNMLWAHRMDGWIKKFNAIAFQGACAGDPNCADRLVGDFMNFSTWRDSAADFQLTLGNLAWDGCKLDGYEKARIMADSFHSETEFLSWKLASVDAYLWKESNLREQVLKLVPFQADRKRLEMYSPGMVTEAMKLARPRLQECLVRLENKSREGMDSWRQSRLDKAIQDLRQGLDEAKPATF